MNRNWPFVLLLVLATGAAGWFAGRGAEFRPTGATPPAMEPSDELIRLRYDSEESRLALGLLEKKNRGLLKEKLELEKQIATLSASLAIAKAEEDRRKVARDRLKAGKSLPVVSGGTPRALNEGRVAEGNRELQLIVLDIGADADVKHGMMFSIVRRGEWIARVRVIDVREHISGATIEKLNGAVFPAAGDRILRWNEN